MITPEQTIVLARATLDQGLNFSRTDHITRATDAELVKFAQEVIDAATLELRQDLNDARNGWEDAAKCANDLILFVGRVARLNAAAGEIGPGMLAQLVEDANKLLS